MTAGRSRKKPTAGVKKKAKYLLRLYVTGTTGKSVRAIQNVRRICETLRALQVRSLPRDCRFVRGRRSPPLRNVRMQESQT